MSKGIGSGAGNIGGQFCLCGAGPPCRALARERMHGRPWRRHPGLTRCL